MVLLSVYIIDNEQGRKLLLWAREGVVEGERERGGEFFW